MAKVAIIDIDNTLWQFCDAFYEELRKINGSFPAPDRWTSFDIWKGYCSEEDFLGAINSIHFNQDREDYRPYPESKGFLSALREEGFHIIVASHRLAETRDRTERWLTRHGLVFDELHLSFDKTALFPSADVVVDDAPQTLEKAVESGLLATGLSFPWNRAQAGNGFRLFGNLKEVLHYITAAVR